VIGYLDTSAFVPLLVTEPGSALCQRFWDDADSVASCRLMYVETAAALAQAVRIGRIRVPDREAALASLDELWASMNHVEVDDALVRDAAALAHDHGLRGDDAVHCASARQLLDHDLVAASGDRNLLSAWRLLGLAVLDTSSS